MSTHIIHCPHTQFMQVESNIDEVPSSSNWDVWTHRSKLISRKYLWVEPAGSSLSDVHYICMWKHCNTRLTAIHELDDHLEFHARNFSNSPNLSCHVLGCEILVTSTEELLRHLKMHVFHAQKLAIGLVQVRHRHSDLEICNFPSSSRLVYQGDALICEWADCLETFTDINLYMSHLSKHIRDDTTVPLYSCKWGDCEASFKSKSLLHLHIQQHSGDKSCACPFCGTFFVNNSKLLDHVTRRQEGSSEFSCYFCQKNFKTDRLLKIHCKRHLRNFRCEICSTALESAFDLQRHVATAHAKIYNYSCDVCQKGFYQKSDLQRHLAIHSNTLPYECGVCKERFRWDKQLRHHVKTHQMDYINSPYHCHLCNATYKRGSALSKHLTTAHQIAVPTGFSRFQYKKCADGLFRLQTRRWTGVEVMEIGAES